MKHPPYHLRVNKAIDRFLLLEVLNMLKEHWKISDYTYYGFGGPFLDDCRLIHDRCPEIQIVSIEKNVETFKRQKFHRFSKELDLRNEDFTTFLAKFSSSGGEIFWLDYTDLRFRHFDEFMSILGKVSEKSIVKITIRAEPDMNKDLADFRKEYNEVLPGPIQEIPTERPLLYIELLQDMVKIASQKALPPVGESVFQLLSSTYYSDQTQMLSVTGIVCNRNEVSEIRQWFKDWAFINLTWSKPRKIDVPILSIKERLQLEKYLPTTQKTGRALSRALGYKIDKSKAHIEKLEQYEEFYQYYPYFVRVSI